MMVSSPGAPRHPLPSNRPRGARVGSWPCRRPAATVPSGFVLTVLHARAVVVPLSILGAHRGHSAGFPGRRRSTRGPRSRSRTASAHLRSPFALAPAARREFNHCRFQVVFLNRSAVEERRPADLREESGGAEVHRGVESEACLPDAERCVPRSRRKGAHVPSCPANGPSQFPSAGITRGQRRSHSVPLCRPRRTPADEHSWGRRST